MVVHCSDPAYLELRITSEDVELESFLQAIKLQPADAKPTVIALPWEPHHIPFWSPTLKCPTFAVSVTGSVNPSLIHRRYVRETSTNLGRQVRTACYCLSRHMAA